LRSMFVDEIENVGPVAAIALDDVKFAPQKLFRRDQEKTFATNVHLRCVLEPVIIDDRALIGHGPDDVYDDVPVVAAINPCSVVRQLSIVICETRFCQRLLSASAVTWANIEIN